MTVSALLRDAVAIAPSGRAVEDDRLALSFDELSARVRHGAALLGESGVARGDRVGIFLPNSVGFVESFLAVLARGAAAFPLGTTMRPIEARRLLSETPVRALIAAPGVARELTAGDTACLASALDGLVIEHVHGNATRAPGGGDIERSADSLGGPTPIARPEPSGREAEIQRSDTALIAYSSGTVAGPHLVVRTHENLWWEAENFWSATRLGPSDVVFGIVPLSHAHGLGNAMLAALRAGARLVLRPRFLRRETLDVLTRERVTVFPTVPFMIRMLAATDRRRSWDLSHLRFLFSAGAPLAREVYEAFHSRFGIPVRQLYGLSEAGSVTLNAAPAADVDPESVGTPLGSARVTIEDVNGNELPPGHNGEIVVRSPAAAGGVATPLRTRDLGHWSPRGDLVITGRTSLFINTAGNKVDPAEVEAALRLHPAVQDVAVFGVPAPHDEQLVAAAVVLRAPCEADVLRLHCRTLLAPHKVPRVLRFLPRLPRSALGKVLIGRLLAEV